MEANNSKMLEDIVRTTIGKWNNQDYEACEHLESMLHSKGWEVLANLWENLEKTIWQRMQKDAASGKTNSVYQLIGIREGFELATTIHHKVLVEKEEQRRLREIESKRIVEQAMEGSRRMDEDGQ